MTMITDLIRHGTFRDYRRASSRPSLWAVAGTAVANFATTLLVWHERARQRRQLLALSDRALQDFGRSLADAASEGDKPFWRA